MSASGRHSRTDRTRLFRAFTRGFTRPSAFLAVLALVASTATGVIFVVAQSAAPAAATPNNPPNPPAAGVQIYSEPFVASTTGNGIPIQSYTGPASAGGNTYFASPNWINTANECNGWVLSYNNNISPSSDPACATNSPTGWTKLRGFAAFLGAYQAGLPSGTLTGTQMTSPPQTTNGALSAFTNNPSATPMPGSGGTIMFETKSSIGGPSSATPSVGGHFYAVSSIFAATSCGVNDPSLNFSLIQNGTVDPSTGAVTPAGALVPLTSGVDPCTTTTTPGFTNPQAYSGPVDPFGGPGGGVVVGANIVTYTSGAFQVPANGTPLGLRLQNTSLAVIGNDLAYDLPQIVDVTPQLDKSFSPTTIQQGQTTTLTYTITNTTDKQAKAGWSFTDNLPAGLSVASGATLGGSCTNVSGSASGGTITVTSGTIGQGVASCTVTVTVTSNTPGNYNNSGCTNNDGSATANCTNNFPTIVGLYPPGTAPLTVTPVINMTIQKDVDSATYSPGQLLTYTVKVGNAGPSDAVNAAFTDPVPASLTGVTWSCAVTTAGAAANLPTVAPTGNATTCGTTPSGTGNSIASTIRINVGGLLTYTIHGTVAAGTTGTIVNNATVVPPANTTIPNMPGGGPNPTPGSTTQVPTIDVNCPPAPGVGCSDDAQSTPNPATYTVEKTSSAGATVNPGTTITYTLQIRNTSGFAYPAAPQAQAASFSDNLAGVLADANYVANSATTVTPGWTFAQTGSTLTGFGPLGASPAVVTVTYQVTVKNPDPVPPGTGTITNVVTPTGPGGTCAPAPATCTTTTTVNQPNLVVSKSASPSSTTTVQPGGAITYTLTFANTTGAAPAPVNYTDNLADVIDDATVTTNPAQATGTGLTVGAISGGAFTITGSVPAGGTSTVTYTVTVNTPDAGNHVLNNYVVPTGTPPPASCLPANTLCTTHPVPNLVVTKSATPASTTAVAEGSVITYTLTFDNTIGQAPATVAWTDDLTDVLDDATVTAAPVLATGSGLIVGPITNTTFTITGSLAAGGTATVTYSVTVNNPDNGNRVLNNYVVPTGSTPPASCVTGNPLCTSHPVQPPAVTPPPPPAGPLAYTGMDTPLTPTLVIGGLSLVIGAGLVLLATRRRGQKNS